MFASDIQAESLPFCFLLKMARHSWYIELAVAPHQPNGRKQNESSLLSWTLHAPFLFPLCYGTNPTPQRSRSEWISGIKNPGLGSCLWPPRRWRLRHWTSARWYTPRADRQTQNRLILSSPSYALFFSYSDSRVRFLLHCRRSLKSFHLPPFKCQLQEKQHQRLLCQTNEQAT